MTAYKSGDPTTLNRLYGRAQGRPLRAGQQELVDTEKVIRAQLMEALMSAQHLKARYDHVVLQSTLNLLVGTEVLRQLQGAP